MNMINEQTRSAWKSAALLMKVRWIRQGPHTDFIRCALRSGCDTVLRLSNALPCFTMFLRIVSFPKAICEKWEFPKRSSASFANSRKRLQIPPTLLTYSA